MKKSEIMKEVFYALMAIGAIAVALTIPNAALILRDFHKPLRKYKPEQIKRSLYYLHSRDLVGIGKEADKTTLVITKEGNKRFLKFKIEDMQIKPQKKWDGRWRMVIFDIPERYKYARQIFSKKLREIGFMPLQKSAWVCPYPCQKEIEFLSEVYEINPFIRIVQFDKTELEYSWRKKFKLF